MSLDTRKAVWLGILTSHRGFCGDSTNVDRAVELPGGSGSTLSASFTKISPQTRHLARLYSAIILE